MDYGDGPHHSRRGHTPQISISDDSHHVTEAIGGMYGSDDEDYVISRGKHDPRPLSFIRSPAEKFDVVNSARASPPARTPLARTVSNEKVVPPNSSPPSVIMAAKGDHGSENSPVPPQLSRKSSSDTAVQQFPLNDIGYESSPAAVAQELSNLQAIRRMSMNVDMADPDLPNFTSAISPSPSDDEDDASRSFWVPARLHPELAPKEFKTFVEDRVDRIRQRSGSGDSLLPTSLERSDSGGSLRRRRSMLSRQINNPKGYEDGAERLERKRSEGRSHQPLQHSDVETLAELETLVTDPEEALRKLSLDTTRQSLDSGVEVSATQDMPILPPVGMSLKRSTRTTYRRKSVRKGDFSKRGHSRRSDQDGQDSANPPPASANPEEAADTLVHVQTDPSPPRSASTSRVAQPQNPSRLATGIPSSSENLIEHARNPPSVTQEARTSSEPPRSQFQSRISSNGRTTAQIPGVPQTSETPPHPIENSTRTNMYTLPERKSSHTPPPSGQHSTSTPPRSSSSPARGAHTRPPLISQRAQHGSNSTLDDISSKPSPLPGSGSTRTDALTMVPTFEEKNVDEKKGNEKKGSWNWLLGGEEKERERQREREREERERDDKAARKGKPTSSRAKGSDKTRLDVLQSSIDGSPSPRGRESLVLDRESIQLDDDRKKHSPRKSSENSRKGKESGILSAIFGGGRRAKAAEESAHKKRHHNRPPSPEPPPRILKPDIDYNWTRFSILEERAIYRMAHIKLANPKRALHSQVLLSNFMYSYLAKVQMMHPQMQIPAAQKTAQAKPQNASRGQSQERQAGDYSQYQGWQEQQYQQQQQQQQHHNQYQQQHHNQQSKGDSMAGAERGSNTESPDDGNGSHHSNHASNSSEQHDYLGYAKHEQSFEQSLWDDADKEDLW